MTLLKVKRRVLKESDNWVDWNDILKLQRKYGREIKKKKAINNLQKNYLIRKILDLIQKYLVISLYSLHAPRD